MDAGQWTPGLEPTSGDVTATDLWLPFWLSEPGS